MATQLNRRLLNMADVTRALRIRLASVVRDTTTTVTTNGTESDEQNCALMDQVEAEVIRLHAQLALAQRDFSAASHLSTDVK